MSTEDKSKQIGQLMLDKQASEKALAEFTIKAKNIGNKFEAIGRALVQDPSLLAFPHESIDIRFHNAQHLSDGTIATADEVKALTNAIRIEQVKLWGYEQDLKNLGF